MPTIADATHPLPGIVPLAYAARAVRVPLQVGPARRPSRRGRAAAILSDGVDLIALLASIPVAVLVVGTPIALTLLLILWIGRQALGLM
jgi:hypothetical protein